VFDFVLETSVGIGEPFELIVSLLEGLLLLLHLNFTLLLATQQLIHLYLVSLVDLYFINAELCDLLFLGHHKGLQFLDSLGLLFLELLVKLV
jgi:hypothetical protein